MATSTVHASSTSEFISGFVSQEDLNFFRENGVVCIRGIIGNGTIETLRAEIRNVIEGRLARAEAAGEPRPTGPQYHAIMRPSADSEIIDDFRLNSVLPKIARDLMQSQKVIVFGDTLFEKEAGALVKTPWHHDMSYWPFRGEQACSTWVALDPVTKENGALEYVAGSHKWGRMFVPKGFGGAHGWLEKESEFEIIPDFDAERDRYEILTWDLEPGDVLIHHGLTVHGAGENTREDLNRRAYAPRYVGEDGRWEPKYYNESTDPRRAVLQKGDPLDRFGIHPVAFEL
jgi:ectoine hydroxylase-related dioxygenase (phytanoyl-CoA dioxygenase family)